IGGTWNPSRTRGLQDFVGITDSAFNIARVSFSVPKTWVFFYSQMTGRWVDGKIYGLFPSSKFDDYSGESVLFLADGGKEAVVSFYEMDQSSVERWTLFLSESRCDVLISGDSDVLTCNVVHLGGHEAVRVVGKNSAAYYLPGVHLIIA